MIRRVLFVAVLVVVVVPLSAVTSGAQQEPDLTVTVRKVVVGTGAPSSVAVDCEGNPDDASALDTVVLNFDGQGNPTTASPADAFDIVDGAWVVQGTSGAGGQCTFTETATGGAASTAWTCAYTFDPVDIPQSNQIEQAGCQAAAGTGVGPVDVIYPSGAEVDEQSSTVVFTNTFTSTPIQPAAQVVAQPAFTG
jgi:hypothetical protein